MPLPQGGNTTWPPVDVAPYIDQATASAAWWSGRVDDLKTTADTGSGARRRFWGRRKTSDVTTATHQLHVPLAGDIATVAADLLFGDVVGLTTDDTAAQAELENLEENLGLTNLFAEAAEWAAATGGCFLRYGWDKSVADHALVESIPQQQAVPDFKWGRLVAATVWKTVHETRSDVWRLLERHEKGRVLAGLYVGTRTELGDPRPLSDLPETEGLSPELILPGLLSDQLLLGYVPNVRPNPELPQKPLGRADWQGAEPMLDALDETWSALVREIRLAQAHIIIPQEWLRLAGHRPGTTAQVDPDSEVWTAFNIEGEEWVPSVLQPDLRVEALLAAAMAETERIVSKCGYSPQTFGLHIEGRAESGTALRVREGKTDKTVGKKQRYWQPELRRGSRLLLDIGAEIFRTPTIGDPDKTPVRVGWPELQQDPKERAEWIRALREAQAVSIRTAVVLGQPDLDEDQVDEEVALIEAETGGGMVDPTTVGRGPGDGESDELDGEDLGGEGPPDDL